MLPSTSSPMRPANAPWARCWSPVASKASAPFCSAPTVTSWRRTSPSAFPQSTLVANEPVVHDDLAKVIRVVDRPDEGLHLMLDMRGTPLQRRVWEKLRAISVGRTVTYVELARWIGPPASARVVAGACTANPIA